MYFISLKSFKFKKIKMKIQKWIFRSFSTKSFSVPSSFLKNYVDRPPPFGFDGLGELVYQRTYSRIKADGEKEQW
jgi:hypothetical protein